MPVIPEIVPQEMSTTVPFTACASTPLSSPTFQPSMTIVQPPTHTMLPSTNAMQPSTSFAHPSTPVVQPLTPVMQPSIPIVQPSTQVKQPSIPVVQPWMPIVQSQTSHVQPYQPMSSATLAAANILKPTDPKILQQEHLWSAFFIFAQLQYVRASVAPKH